MFASSIYRRELAQLILKLVITVTHFARKRTCAKRTFARLTLLEMLPSYMRTHTSYSYNPLSSYAEASLSLYPFTPSLTPSYYPLTLTLVMCVVCCSSRLSYVYACYVCCVYVYVSVLLVLCCAHLCLSHSSRLCCSSRVCYVLCAVRLCSSYSSYSYYPLSNSAHSIHSSYSTHSSV